MEILSSICLNRFFPITSRETNCSKVPGKERRISVNIMITEPFLLEESAYHARAGTDASQPAADDNPGARHMAKADDTHSGTQQHSLWSSPSERLQCWKGEG